MPAMFTSGWFGNGERAWHNEGIVTDGTLPAREAFETARALFRVETRQLSAPNLTPLDSSDDRLFIQTPVYCVFNCDTNKPISGGVSEQYECVQNEALLRMAEFIREEADMDSVVVLADGARVAFTATLKNASAEIVSGDVVKRRIVGYLGHDGGTGCGAKFTDIRVVCQNTWVGAMNDSGKRSSITHKAGANDNFDALIKSIDIARQDFREECDLMREFSKYAFGPEEFTRYIEKVYDIDPESESTWRKRDKLERAFYGGFGSEFHRGSLWGAVNAITQIETSTIGLTRSEQDRRFGSANFGPGFTRSKKAVEVAKQILCDAC